MHLGIDYGTTNSSVARFDGNKLYRLGIDPANDNPNILPSLIYINRQHHAAIGTRAATEYLTHETGRSVSWEERTVGEIDVVAADMSYVQTVSVLVDTAAHGRLLQYVKTALRDPNYQGTQIFDRFYPVDELITLILHPLKRMAEQAFGETCEGVVIGRPVRFSDDPKITARAEEIIFKAARWAGFHDIRFELEPVGATYYYHRSAPRRQTAFIFDFGGGTLDLTIAEVGEQSAPRIIATHGVLVGGDDLDRRLMQSLYKYFGAQKRNGKEAVPPHLLDLLDNWQTMPILSRPANLKLLDELKMHVDRDAIAALRTLVTQNLGFKLFRTIEQTKKQLSAQQTANLDFESGDLCIHETITRAQFERMIEKEIALVEKGIHATLAKARLKPEDIDVVLRTGGTSAVPVFATLLAKIFGAEKIAQMELLTSVVGGLAITAHEQGGHRSHSSVRYLGHAEPWVGRLRVPSNRPYTLYNFRIGGKCYIDSAFTLTRIPVELSGLPALRMAQADKNLPASEGLQFDLGRPARIFIAYDATAKTLPNWLKEFAAQPEGISVEQLGTERWFRLFAKDFPAGRVTLGGNRAEKLTPELFLNYLVILQASI
ncbi:MAG: Hsp70 family protein [Chloroflexi bacterium]|nr:Hsp70 family protein [Chloroflexota bacterium]